MLEMYTADSGGLVQSIDLVIGSGGFSTADPRCVTRSPDGMTVLIGDAGGRHVLMVNTAERKLAAVFPIGAFPCPIVTDGERAVVAGNTTAGPRSRERGSVALLDLGAPGSVPQAVRLGSRVTGYRNLPDGSVSAHIEHADGSVSEENGALLIGADGIHSAVRAQMHPAQPPIHWGGAIMWRGTTWGKPIRSGSSFVGLGTHRQRMVFYPISHPDPQTGLSIINWIAEVTMDNSEGWKQSGWFRQVSTDDFIHHFADWIWDWLDVPALIRQADTVFENPMIDRDPVPTWHDGAVALLGDAAHAMYPTGSNGGSQAIVDARILGAAIIEHGVTPEALAAFDEKLCGPISQLILRNRGAGPFGLLNMVDERCGGRFDNIDDVIPPNERTEFMAGYKAAAGFAIEKLNKAPPTIPHGAKVRGTALAV